MTSKIKELKDLGNNAFMMKQFEEAVQFYKEAIALEETSPSEDAKLLGLIYSNLAQTYLELKK
jgi:tetratricopeptide (TPR) repeat protein